MDVFLDETTKGLSGNLALVVDARPLGELGDVQGVLSVLGGLSSEFLPSGYRTPVTLRFRVLDGAHDAGEADTEVRFKLRIPVSALQAGASAVAALASTTVRSFETLLASPELGAYLDED